MLFKGSYAQKYYDSNYREPLDVDILRPMKSNAAWMINPSSFGDKRIEIHELPNDIYDILSKDSKNGYISEQHLYTIKLSHSRYNVKWDKTLYDVIYYQKRNIALDEVLYDKLLEYWKQYHGENKNLSLNRSKEQFFDNAVKCPIHHDTIHEIVAYYEKPLYTTVLKDNEEVYTDWKKFKNLSHLDQVRMMREEIWSIGMERWGISSGFRLPAGAVYQKSLKKVFHDLTKNKFQDFMARNMIFLVDKDGNDWYKKVQNYYNKNIE